MTKAAELAKMGEVLTNSQIGGRRNIIINGAMQVAQRGTSFTYGGGAYNLDRFYALDGTDGTFTVEQSTTAPADFTNSLKVTITTADSSVGASQYASLRQNIEGFNCSQLNWGSSDAQTVTLSFYVRSSVTGTFGGSLLNAGTRSYPFTYTISSADTWERILVTIDGDTTGTWATDNTVGINVNFNIGNGSTFTNTAGAWASGAYYGATGEVNLIETLNATFFITGIQLEVGEQATTFEHRSFGEELALCQRYYEKSFPYATAPASNLGDARVTIGTEGQVHFKVRKRANATMTSYGSLGTGSNWHYFTGSWVSASPGMSGNEVRSTYYLGTTSFVAVSGQWAADAEL